MIYCINFRYFTAPASKFSKPASEIFYIKRGRYAVLSSAKIIANFTRAASVLLRFVWSAVILELAVNFL